MDRRRRNPSSRAFSSYLKPPRPPRTGAFHLEPASRPLPDPISPDGRHRKKVRFASGAAGNNRQDAGICGAEKSKPQLYDGKTAEYKFFKNFWEESGHRSHSCKQSHQSIEPKISKQKDGMGMEPLNAMSFRKLPVKKNTLCSDQVPATPSKHKEICDRQLNLQASHSDAGKDTPQLNPHGHFPSIHVLTPVAQTSFEVAGISRNIDIEQESGRVFSEKRSKLLKLAAKTASMETTELLQRRSDFVADILQRLGIKNIMSTHHKESIKQSKIDQKHAPDFSDHENMIDYGGSDFDLLTKQKISGKESYPHAGYGASEPMALPWEYYRDLPSFLDQESDFCYGGNEACECMALPWAYTPGLSSFPYWGCDFAHNQVSKLLLEDVQPPARGKPALANDLNLKVQNSQYSDLEREPMLSSTLAESIPNKLFSRCQIEEQHVVPCTTSNISYSVGLEEQDPKEEEIFNNPDSRLLLRVDQLPVKCIDSNFVDHKHGTLDHHHIGYFSRCLLNDSNSIMSLGVDGSFLNSISSTSEHPYELGWKSLHDSAVSMSRLPGLEEKDLKEAELFGNAESGLLLGFDQLPQKCATSSFVDLKYRMLNHHYLSCMSNHPLKGSKSTVSLDANDDCLNSLPSASVHPYKLSRTILQDSATDMWPSLQHLQSHGGNLGDALGFMSNEDIYNDLEDHRRILPAHADHNRDLFGSFGLPFFGSCLSMDGIRVFPDD